MAELTSPSLSHVGSVFSGRENGRLSQAKQTYLCFHVHFNRKKNSHSAVSRIWLITLLNVLYIRHSVFTSPKSAFGCMILVAYIIYMQQSWKQLLSFLFHPPFPYICYQLLFIYEHWAMEYE